MLADPPRANPLTDEEITRYRVLLDKGDQASGTTAPTHS